jgi:hypothetical protein
MSSLPQNPLRASSSSWRKLDYASPYEMLLTELELLYWEGVKRDLADILAALRVWNDDRWMNETAEQLLKEQEKNGSEWTGFETFVARAAGQADASIL